MGPPFSLPRNEIADLLFGKSARLFQLHHLWFLWYLLLFAVVAPAVAGIFSRVLPTSAVDTQVGWQFGPVSLRCCWG